MGNLDDIFAQVTRFNEDFIKEGFAYFIKFTRTGDGGPDRPRQTKTIEGHCLVIHATSEEFTVCMKGADYRIRYSDLEGARVTILEMRALE